MSSTLWMNASVYRSRIHNTIYVMMNCNDPCTCLQVWRAQLQELEVEPPTQICPPLGFRGHAGAKSGQDLSPQKASEVEVGPAALVPPRLRRFRRAARGPLKSASSSGGKLMEPSARNTSSPATVQHRELASNAENIQTTAFDRQSRTYHQ